MFAYQIDFQMNQVLVFISLISLGLLLIKCLYQSTKIINIKVKHRRSFFVVTFVDFKKCFSVF